MDETMEIQMRFLSGRKWQSNAISAKKSSGSSESSTSETIATTADHILKSMCIWDFNDMILTVLYVILFLWCIKLIRENLSTWTSGQSSGLLWYLGCTTILCICRFVGFALLPSAATIDGCSAKYQTFQWELDGSGNMHEALHASLLILSTASSALFFSSYSYFAHSLSKVIDILTSEPSDDNSYSSALRYSLLLLFLNVGVWSSIFLLWVARLVFHTEARFIDSIAQFSIACAALITCLMFALHFRRAYYFLQK
jgi:hypothetical protein